MTAVIWGSSFRRFSLALTSVLRRCPTLPRREDSPCDPTFGIRQARTAGRRNRSRLRSPETALMDDHFDRVFGFGQNSPFFIPTSNIDEQGIDVVELDDEVEIPSTTTGAG